MLADSAEQPETKEQLYLRVFRELRPRTKLPEVRVEFCRFADAHSLIRFEDNRLDVRITDLLVGAPPTVLEALARILLCKLFRRPVQRVCSYRYRLYMNRKDVRRTLHLLRQTRGRKHSEGPRGEHHDLEAIFEELNLKYFNGLMARPELGWSRRPSRTTLGHYDPSHNTIIISKILDNPRFGGTALEYVLFHEMLHVKYPVRHDGPRRRVHTKEFRLAEKDFSNLNEAKEILKRL